MRGPDMLSKTLLSLTAIVALGPLMTGCASNQALRASLSDRDDLIRSLRAEKQAIQDRIQSITYDRDQLQMTLNGRALEVNPVRTQDASFRDNMPDVEGPKVDAEKLTSVGVTYSRTGDTSVFQIPSSATFASGSATLSSNGEKALREVIQQLKQNFPASDYFIEGHTDSEPIRRSRFTTNRDLSYHRSRAVHDFLVEQGEVDDSRCVIVAHGPHRPIDVNATPEGRAHNRRVEIVVRKQN